MALAAANDWSFVTVLIENQEAALGTGFLIGQEFQPNKCRIFLATNKHVLHHSLEGRARAKYVIFHLNEKGDDGVIKATSCEVACLYPDGTPIWREHPDVDVDVLVFHVSEMFTARPRIIFKFTTIDHVLDRKGIVEHDITIGEEIIVVGYPLGLRHRTTNFPLFRSGMIATRIGEQLEDETRTSDGGCRKRTLRGFLVDGGVIPGSSGSPVILKPTTSWLQGGNIRMGAIRPPMVLGIIAETRYATISRQIPGGDDIRAFAGLGIAVDAETIKETIALFPNPQIDPSSAGR